MRRDLKDLEKENKEMMRGEMKQRSEDMKFRVSKKHFHSEKNNIIRKRLSPPSGETSGGSRQWRNKKKVGKENAQTEQKKPTNHASDVESELQRAIKATTT